MIAALILFVDQYHLIERFKKEKTDIKSFGFSFEQKKVKRIFPLITVFVIWQLVMPLRHYFVTGYTDWTGDYQQFSWRMKIQHRKLNEFKLSFLDEDKKLIYPIDYKDHLYPDELRNMINRPQMIIQFVNYIEKRVTDRNNLKNYKIVGNISVDFNGQEQVVIFNQNLDLSKISPLDNMYKWVQPIE